MVQQAAADDDGIDLHTVCVVCGADISPEICDGCALGHRTACRPTSGSAQAAAHSPTHTHTLLVSACCRAHLLLVRVAETDGLLLTVPPPERALVARRRLAAARPV
jgi:hypothetical protein